MALDAHPAPEPDWRGGVTVREDPELGAELGRRLATASGEKALGVTDLLAPRRAFWRLTSPPVLVPADRQARLDAGRWLHRALGSVLASEGLLEVRVRRGGLVGRIDVLTDRPIEVKTTSLAVGPEELVSDRPEHVEQLAMYCALVSRSAGRLITVAAHDTTVHELRTVDVRFRDLSAISAEMARRAAQLRSGLASGRADGLPRCRWFDRGCEFQSEKVCDCTGREPDPPSVLLEEVGSLEGRPEVDRELTPRLSKELGSLEPPKIARFRDLIYPRRAYYERTEPARAVEEGGPREEAAVVSNLYGRLVEAVESGTVGEVARLPSRSEEPEEEVTAFRGTPYLLRTSRAWSAPRPQEILGRFPQYALDLGFRCATTGTHSGRVLVGFERAESPQDQLKVFELDFSPVTVLARLFRERVARFERALRDRSPATLEACPAWMYSDCPYRAECGCGAGPGRSQR
jgi:hypothetical protein